MAHRLAVNQPQPATRDSGRQCRTVGALLKDVLVLMKPRVSVLLLLTGLAAAVAAAGGNVPQGTGTFAVLAAMVAGGAAAANHALERDLDRRMERTRSRPVASGRLTPGEAGAVAVLLMVGGIAAAWWLLGPGVASFLAAGAAIYAGLYTLLLKRHTTWNVVWGGLAGACMVWAGWWLGAGGLSAAGLWLGLTVFLWTPAHFWSLAMAKDDDYRAVGLPMLPQVRGFAGASRTMVLTVFLTIAATWISGWFLHAGLLFWLLVMPAGALYLWGHVRLAKGPHGKPAWLLFKGSGIYLLVVFIAAAVGI